MKERAEAGKTVGVHLSLRQVFAVFGANRFSFDHSGTWLSDKSAPSRPGSGRQTAGLPIRDRPSEIRPQKSPSEIQLQPELNDAGGDRRLGDVPECWRGPGGIRVSKLRMVEGIEELSSEFEAGSLDRRSLNEGDVEVVLVGPTQNARAGIAKSGCYGGAIAIRQGRSASARRFFISNNRWRAQARRVDVVLSSRKSARIF